MKIYLLYYMTTLFDNIVFNKDEVSFELHNNNIKLGLANAIRRIFQTEIPNYAITRHSIEFITNSSMLNNDIISQRIPFVPLLYHAFDGKDLSKISISLEKSNKNGTTIISIYSKDIQFTVDGQPIDNTLFLLEPNILLAKLKPNQELHFTGKIEKLPAKKNSIAHSPVSIASMIYKRSADILLEFKEKLSPEQYKQFELSDSYRYYSKLPNNEPAIYVFNIESIGAISTTELVSMVLDILYNKLNYLMDNIDNNDKVSIHTSEIVLDSFDFVLTDEDDTLGNMLQLYLLTDPEIKYAGYRVVHPNENTMIVRTALKNNNTLENNKKVFINNIKNIMNIFKQLQDDWSNKTSNIKESKQEEAPIKEKKKIKIKTT